MIKVPHPDDISDDEPVDETLRRCGCTPEQASQVFHLAMLAVMTYGDREVSQEEKQAFLQEELNAARR